MQSLNLQSLIDAKKDLHETVFLDYIHQFGLHSRIRVAELIDLATLLKELQTIGATSANFQHFYVGYSIAQISKEFDLLRLGENHILNIELKYESSFERIEAQLKQNKYYLRFLKKPVHCFTFVSSTKKLYYMKQNTLTEVSLAFLFRVMQMQILQPNVIIDDLFDPIHYLISPIDDPKTFMQGRYFLTAQQTTYKMDLLSHAHKKSTWFALEGGPGTGKTLLTYDIAKHYIQQKKRIVLLQTNELTKGQGVLKETYHWPIQLIDTFRFTDILDILIIDEAHFLLPIHLEQLLHYATTANVKIILSYDPQYLFLSASPIMEMLEKLKNVIRYELKVILRQNKEIQSFVNKMFDGNYNRTSPSYHSVSLHYFSTINAANTFAYQLQCENWKLIRISGDSAATIPEITSDLIGDEFDQVAAWIDNLYYYKTNNRLSFTHQMNMPSQPTKVLYQALMRTRKKLALIIVNNEPVLKRLLAILHGK